MHNQTTTSVSNACPETFKRKPSLGAILSTCQKTARITQVSADLVPRQSTLDAIGEKDLRQNGWRYFWNFHAFWSSRFRLACSMKVLRSWEWNRETWSKESDDSYACQAKRPQRQAGSPTINVSAAAVVSGQRLLDWIFAAASSLCNCYFAPTRRILLYCLSPSEWTGECASQQRDPSREAGRTKKPHVHRWKGWTHVAHSHARNLFLFSWSSKHCRQLSDCKNTAKPWWVPWPSPLK